MAFELKDGQFTLHKNKFKEGGDKLPDYKGDIMINGELMDLAAWIKTGQNGKWMSGKYGPKRARADEPAPTKRMAPDEDIPF